MALSRRLALGATIGALAAPRLALAAYPDRPVTVVVPLPPGGGTDVSARILAERLGPQLGTSGRVIVENRPGAGTALGAEHVRRAAPDGYTLLYSTAGTFAVNPALGASQIRYHPTRDFTPISVVGSSAMALVVPASSPVRTLPELVAKLRAEPGWHHYGSSGTGSANHLAGALFTRMVGAEVVHSPYRGGNELTQAVVRGEVLYAVDLFGSMIGLVRGGQVRLLAVTSARRDPNYPEAPTMAEAGLPGYVFDNWTGLAAPAGLPTDIATAISQATNRALAEDALRQRMLQLALNPIGDSTLESTRRFFDSELARFQDIVARSGIRVE